MKHQQLEIGKPLEVEVTWYDNCCVPAKADRYQGEVVGWRTTQVIVSIREYAVVRFWKRSGLEVGNRDHQRRGFRLNLTEESESARANKGITVTFDDGTLPIL